MACRQLQHFHPAQHCTRSAHFPRCRRIGPRAPPCVTTKAALYGARTQGETHKSVNRAFAINSRPACCSQTKSVWRPPVANWQLAASQAQLLFYSSTATLDELRTCFSYIQLDLRYSQSVTLDSETACLLMRASSFDTQDKTAIAMSFGFGGSTDRVPQTYIDLPADRLHKLLTSVPPWSFVRVLVFR